MAVSRIWTARWRSDPEARALADRHYSRQTIGATGFVPPGRCVVLKSVDRRAYWVTSWPFAEYVKHEWPGAWICSAFRNERSEVDRGRLLASEMIVDAIACTRLHWADPPRIDSVVGPVGMVTFIDENKVRRSRQPGRCFLKAGFEVIGRTKGGLLSLGLPVDRVPNAVDYAGLQIGLGI